MRSAASIRAEQIAFAIGGIAVLLFGLFATVSIGRIATFGREALQSQQEIMAVDEVAGRISRAQIAVRQYVISGRPGDLEDWDEHAGRLPALVFELEQRGVLSTSDTVSNWITEQLELQRRVIAERQAGKEDEATRLLTSVETKRIRQGVRGSLETLRMQKVGRLQLTQAESPAPGAQWFVAAAAALVFGVFVGAFVYVRRHNAGIRRAQAAISAGERQLRQIADTLPVLIVEFDANEHVLFHNRAFEEFMGGPFGRVRGAHLRDVVGQERYAFIRPYLQQALTGQEVTCEKTDAGPDGEPRIFQLYLLPRMPQRAGEMPGCYIFGTDITELKRIDRLKTEFVSTVSHELRTPLTSIRASLGLIAGGVAGQLPEMADNLVGIAKNNCDRLIRLINDILDVEKIESGKLALRMQKLEIGALVRQAVVANDGFAREHKVRFEVHSDTDGPLHASVDSDRLVRVVTNLVSNAAKFSPEGGTVSVRIGRSADRVRVEVADQGPGIPLEFQSRMFQKFSQADSSDTRNKGGSGLGLSIARGLVETMGGKLGFHSVPGAGATFFFEIPLWQDSPPGKDRIVSQPAEGNASRSSGERSSGLPDREAAARLADGAGRTELARILHVEDDADMRQLVATLTREHATCVAAASLAAARAQLRAHTFDLILLDIDLGEDSGWDLLPEVRDLQPDVPVIVFSAMEASEAESGKVEAALVKSFTCETELLRQVQRLLKAPVRQQLPSSI